MGMLTLKSY